MDEQVNISDILQPPQEIESHYLEIKHQKPQITFAQSTTFKKIFYTKRTMRQLLEERTQLCFELELSSKKGKGKQIDQEEMEKFFGLLFKDCPDDLTQFSWTVVEDRGTIYGFLASEDKMVPVCKTCNKTIYVSLRGNIGRIGCSNSSCKVKLLGEFEVGGKPTSNHSSNSKEHQSFVQEKEQVSRGIRKSEVLEEKNEQIKLGIKDKELIKRAARRFAY